MKINKLTFAFGLSLILSLVIVGSASAVFDSSVCESNGGSWEGPTTSTGVCTYPAYQWAPAYLNGTQISSACVNPPTVPVVHIPAEPGRCRITSVNNPIYVGTTFTAEWRGRLNSLRLREPGASILFLEPIPDSVYWTGNASKMGTFDTLGVVDVGTYYASCFGELGPVGAEIKTEVVR